MAQTSAVDAELAQLQHVDLDSLNKKQRTKEYKATLKLLKSKELENRRLALEKFKDIRYLLEGGCLPTFLESMFPKKKTMDYTKEALLYLLVFINTPQKVDQESVPISAMKSIIEVTGSLEIFHVLLDMMLFKEEVKTKGKNKEDSSKNEELELFIHRKASQVMFVIMSNLISNPGSEDLTSKFLNIPDILQKLCSALKLLLVRYNNETSRAQMLQEGFWVLALLVFLLEKLDGGVALFLKEDMISCISTLAKETHFTLFCLQIFDMLTRNNDGLPQIASEERVLLLLDLLKTSVTSLTQPRVVGGITSKDKKDGDKGHSEKKIDSASAKAHGMSKKQVKEDKEAHAAPHEEDVFHQADPTRLLVASIRLIVNIYDIISKTIHECISGSTARKLVSYLQRAVLDESVWEMVRGPPAAPLDVSLIDFVEATCILFGRLGLVSLEVRQGTCKGGAVSAVLTIMQKARIVFGIDLSEKGAETDKKELKRKSSIKPPEKESSFSGNMLTSVFDEETASLKSLELRRLCEKSALHLITQANQVKDSQQETEFNEQKSQTDRQSDNSIRWQSCASYYTDVEMFQTPLDIEPLECQPDVQSQSTKAKKPSQTIPVLEMAASLPQMLQLLASSEMDLNERGVRILAGCSQGSADKFDFARTIAFNTPDCVKKVAAVAEKCGLALLEHRAEVLTSQPLESTSRMVDDEELSYASSTVKVRTIPSVPCAEVLSLALISLEPMLSSSDDLVCAFAIESMVQILAKVLYFFGPIGCFEDGSGAGSAVAELVVTIHDPRAIDWIDPKRSEEKRSKLILRSLVMDVLRIVALADPIYRKYEGVVPPAPGTPLPDSTTQCWEAIVAICKYCFDPCVGIVLSESRFELSDGNVVTIPADHSVVETSVLNSALELFLAIAKCGPRAVAVALEAIMNPKLIVESSEAAPDDKKLSAISGFKDFMYSADFNPIEDDQSLDIEAAAESATLMSKGPSVVTAPSQNKDTASGHVDRKSRRSIVGEKPVEKEKPRGKANLSMNHSWFPPMLFDQVFKEIRSSKKTLAPDLVERPILWPFVVVSGSVLGILANPILKTDSISLSLSVLQSLCRSPLYPEVCQPAVVDVLSAIFLSMGGGVTLSAIFGRFGTLIGDEKGIDFTMYLFSRGVCRETFWKDKAKKEQEAAATSTAGGKKPLQAAKVVKDPKKAMAKGKEKGKLDGQPVGAEESFNPPYEPEEGFEDPNHGPDKKLWAGLLSVPYDDQHCRTIRALPLMCTMMSGQQDMTSLLIQCGTSVNAVDNVGRTSLMYAMALGDEKIVGELLAAGAAVDTIDGHGNPTIKYAFFTMPAGGMEKLTKLKRGSYEEIEFIGKTNLLDKMLAAGAEVIAMDSSGCGPTHYAVGLGSIQLELGGYTVVMKSEAYTPGSAHEGVLTTCKKLVSAGAQAGGANKSGLSPLHVASARGDFQLVEYFISIGSPLSANTLDGFGFFPLHYVAASALCSAKDVIETLLHQGQGRTARKAIFVDNDPGQSKLSKYLAEVDSVLDFILGEASCPTVINGVRLSSTDILTTASSTGLTCFHLALAGHVLADAPSAMYIPDDADADVDRRLDLVEFLLLRVTPVERVQEVLSTSDTSGLTMLHALCLLGVPSSDMSELFSQCLAYCGDVDGKCRSSVPRLQLPQEWTPLHAAIARNNPFVVSQLLKEGADISLAPYVHFLSVCDADDEVIELVVSAACQSANFNVLLNSESEISVGDDSKIGSPLHLATRCGKSRVISVLMRSKKVNPNLQDSSSKSSALLEACAAGSIELVSAFATDSDRLDLSIENIEQKTCVDVVLEENSLHVLKLLISMRKNDVVERILQVKRDGKSTLYALELENMSLAKAYNATRNTTKEAVHLVAETQTNPAVDAGEDSSIDDVTEGLTMCTLDEEVSSPAPASATAYPPAPAPGHTLMSAPALSAADVEDLVQRLEKSNELVKLLIETVKTTGVVPADFHAHPCYAQGKLYDEL